MEVPDCRHAFAARMTVVHKTEEYRWAAKAWHPMFIRWSHLFKSSPAGLSERETMSRGSFVYEEKKGAMLSPVIGKPRIQCKIMAKACEFCKTCMLSR